MLGKKPKMGKGQLEIATALGGLASLSQKLENGKKLNAADIKSTQAQIDELHKVRNSLESSTAEAETSISNIKAILKK